MVAPNYDYDIAQLVAAYKRAVADILRELYAMDTTAISQANARATLAEIARILKELNAESAAWAATNIPRAVTDGITSTIVALGAADTVEAAEKIVKFNRMNADLIKTAIADTQADLLAVTQNIDRKTRDAVRTATMESMRANMAAGINGRRTISRDILTRMRAQLGDSVNTGIIDAAGRRWKPEVYVDMAVRTKMMRTHTEATINEAVARDALFGVISRHGARDACAKYEGKIVKLTPDAPGDYPFIGDLPRRDIFHPNCRHVVSPVRKPEFIEGGT
ncbi:phage minor capsid protein [Paenibacillus xanthanilyticus]|uniref:Phage minor capsid protein n=1 Tax=Paenibacillus xanthanilyticus TaxID=1783531 RepID=A0ABV8KC41_9BACL